jgi:hypothetical protein
LYGLNNAGVLGVTLPSFTPSENKREVDMEKPPLIILYTLTFIDKVAIVFKEL